MSTRRTIFIILFLILLGLAAFAISPFEVGSLRTWRGEVYLKYWRIIAPEESNPQILVVMLRSRDEDDQKEAAFSIGVLDPDPFTSDELRRYLLRPDVLPGTKDVAIWSLGELRSTPALPALRSLLDNDEYDQENLQKAIDKIEGRIERGILP